MTKGTKRLLFVLLIILSATAINPTFNFQGTTVLGHFPWGKPVTKEALYFGFSTGIMLSGILCWFSCFTNVFTSEKILYLFGKTLPSLGLIFSMTLSFAPRFTRQFKIALAAQKGVERENSKGLIHRLKKGATVVLAVIFFELENSVTTADSMKSRGYGTGKRSSYSDFIFSKRDAFVFATLFLLIIIVLAGVLKDIFYFKYYPVIQMQTLDFYTVFFYFAFIIISFLPVLTNFWEELKWK
jgi:energy-coupling factor transport system permease protein